MKKKIVVFGSFVVDLMGRGPHLPVPGETVKSGFFKMGAGGKGFPLVRAAAKSRSSFLRLSLEANFPKASLATKVSSAQP